MRLLSLILAVFLVDCLNQCRAETYREVTVTRTQSAPSAVTVTNSYSSVQPASVVQVVRPVRRSFFRSNAVYVNAAVAPSASQSPTPASDVPSDSPPALDYSSVPIQSSSTSTVTRTSHKTKTGCQCGCGRKRCHCRK